MRRNFPTEMAFHFSGVHALDKPGIFVYPKVMVCIDCGFPGLQRRKSERAQLLKDVSKREKPSTLLRSDSECYVATCEIEMR